MQIPNPFPWYDSIWLSYYHHAIGIIQAVRPHQVEEFERAFVPLRTRSDFDVQIFDRIVSEPTMARLELVIAALKATQLELHELERFGRFIVHNQSFVSDLHQELIDVVGEAAGEPVEPCYNFISLYREGGHCPMHLDAPEAKWTLDLCVRQSDPWPISFSRVVPWPDPPEDTTDTRPSIHGEDGVIFRSVAMQPEQAVLFSGSSQWHYRDVSAGRPGGYWDLVFFHFIPVGTRDLVQPKNWARMFSIPELASLADYPGGPASLDPGGCHNQSSPTVALDASTPRAAFPDHPTAVQAW